MTAGEIARSLVDGTGPGGPHPAPLGQEGVVIGEIDEEFGPTYPNVAVNYAKVSKLLDALASSAQGIWNINELRELNFHPYDTVPGQAPDLDELLTPANVLSRNPRYRNQQIVRGGHDQTSVQVEEFEKPGSSDQATYVVSYPLALEPEITVNGVPQTLGIRGLDQTGFDWYWNKNSPILTADDPSSILPNQIIQVTYTGLYDALVRTSNPIEIDNQADREDSANSGTTGLVEEIEVTADYDTISDAITIAGTLLIAWSQTSGEAKFSTDIPGLVPGQVIEIPLPAPTQGMDPDRFTEPDGTARTVLTEFTVRTVETFDLDGINLRYRVTAIKDAQVGTWRSFWSDTLDPFDEDESIPDRYVIRRGGHTYYYFPLGGSVLAVPPVMVAGWLGRDMAEPADEVWLQNRMSCGRSGRSNGKSLIPRLTVFAAFSGTAFNRLSHCTAGIRANYVGTSARTPRRPTSLPITLGTRATNSTFSPSTTRGPPTKSE